MGAVRDQGTRRVNCNTSDKEDEKINPNSKYPTAIKQCPGLLLKEYMGGKQILSPV